MGWGEAFSLASALCWSVGVIAYKRLGEKLPPLRLNLLKNLLVLALLVPTTLVLRGAHLPDLSATDIAICLLSGLIGIGIADTLYFRALNRLGAGRMGVVGNFYSPFVIVLSFAFLGERLSAQQMLGFVAVSAGVLIVNEAQGPELTPAQRRNGLIAGIVAVLLMAAAIVMVKRVLERNDLLWVSAIRMLGGVAGMLALTGMSRTSADAAPVALDRRGWLLLIAAALVGQLLAMLLWLAGYKYTTASVASVLNESASIFIVLLAWLLLREPITRRRAVGVCCTLGGVACMLL